MPPAPLAVLLALALAGPAAGQTVTPLVEVRLRTELDARDLSGADDPVLFHLLRTRLGVEARPARGLALVVQAQDARLWGGEDPTRALGTLDGDADQLDLHQAFVALDSLGGSAASLRLGRQEISLGTQRLVGAVGWSNVGRSFDAARVRWTRGAVAVDGLAAQLVTPVGTRGGQALAGLFAAWTPGPGRAVETFAFGDVDDADVVGGPDEGARRRERLTAGVRATETWGRWSAEAELVGQAGAHGPDSTARRTIRAWLGSAELSAQVGPARVAVGATRLSGDGDASDGTDRRFDTLFATNHKFYGAMDYFPTRAGSGGLDDLQASVAVTLGRWRTRLAAHRFASAVDAPGGRFLGTELDLSAGAPLLPGARIDAGASVFRPADRLGSETTTAWSYLMLTASF